MNGTVTKLMGNKRLSTVKNKGKDRVVQKKPEENVQKVAVWGCTSGLPDHTQLVCRNVAAVCRLAGHGLRVAGKENGVSILKSIDEGPFQMGTTRDTLLKGTDGVNNLVLIELEVYSDLSPEDIDRIWDNVENGSGSSETNERRSRINMYDEFEHFRRQGEIIHGGLTYVDSPKSSNDMRNIKMTMSRMQLNSKFVNNMLPEWGRFITAVNLNRGEQDNVVDEDVDEQPVQDLALNVDNMFQADDCDAFDSDVTEAPTAHAMFLANLSSADPVYDEASPSYDSDILSEVPDHDNYQDAVCEHHEVHEMHDKVQPNYVVDSHADYTSDSNMILYDQYVNGNAVPVVQSNVSSVPNNAYMMILNDNELSAQCVSVTTQNNVVDKSLIAELATYKEQVELYERRAKFELTKNEQKINEQLRIVIADRNLIEENLKRELHSVKLQLTTTINHNK
ncbi:hypothetical protein Tco_0209764 [Tanacetum coccineum]